MSVMNPIEEVSLEGFQIVASDMFVHLPRKSDATCSLCGLSLRSWGIIKKCTPL